MARSGKWDDVRRAHESGAIDRLRAQAGATKLSDRSQYVLVILKRDHVWECDVVGPYASARVAEDMARRFRADHDIPEERDAYLDIGWWFKVAPLTYLEQGDEES